MLTAFKNKTSRVGGGCWLWLQRSALAVHSSVFSSAERVGEGRGTMEGGGERVRPSVALVGAHTDVAGRQSRSHRVARCL